MKAHWQYLKYVIRHKWYVFLACLEYGLIWRGIKHDWTKFLPSEWFPYVAYFYGKKVAHPTHKELHKVNGEFTPVMVHPEQVNIAFDRAWNHHQKANSHHWQYWLLSPDNPRPNFTHQSMDCITHGWVARGDNGKKVALIWDDYIKEWPMPDGELILELERDLYNTPIPLEMPLVDAKEMVADWRGAGMALGKPKTWEWYEANKRHIFLHPNTRAWVEKELADLKHFHEVDKYRPGAWI